MLVVFLPLAAESCRRLLGDAVTSFSDTGRALGDGHLSASEFDDNGVLLLEAEGSPCSSAKGGDSDDGRFRVTFDIPEKGCYRVDAHAGGEECGFGGETELTLGWCAGKSSELVYQQHQGWTPLGIYPFYTSYKGEILQEEGAVDAFRVVKVSDCEEDPNPLFASIVVESDATELPEDFTVELAKRVEEFGQALTASLHPSKELGRRLNDLSTITVDFDMNAKRAPTKQVDETVGEICSMLEQTVCRKLEIRYDQQQDVYEKTDWVTIIAVCAVAILFAGLVCLRHPLNACVTSRMGQGQAGSRPSTPKSLTVSAMPELEEKPEIEDDNVSTVTPCSIPDSLVSDEVAWPSNKESTQEA
jgi:hypothetical protein